MEDKLIPITDEQLTLLENVLDSMQADGIWEMRKTYGGRTTYRKKQSWWQRFYGQASVSLSINIGEFSGVDLTVENQTAVHLTPDLKIFGFPLSNKEQRLWDRIKRKAQEDNEIFQKIHEDKKSKEQKTIMETAIKLVGGKNWKK